MKPVFKNTAAMPPHWNFEPVKTVPAPSPKPVAAPAKPEFKVTPPAELIAAKDGKTPEQRKAAAAKREAATKERLGGWQYREYKKARGLGATLSVDWWFEHSRSGLCEATGASLADREGSPWAPTVCRRDPRLGWTPDNCLVVCAMYAACRGLWLEKDFFQFLYAAAHREGLDAQEA